VRLQVLIGDVWQEIITQDSPEDNSEIQRGSTPWERSYSRHWGTASLTVCQRCLYQHHLMFISSVSGQPKFGFDVENGSG